LCNRANYKKGLDNSYRKFLQRFNRAGKSQISIFNDQTFDESAKSQKINLLSFRPGSGSGMTANPESSHFNSFWTPAFAGVTGLGLFTKQSTFGILNFGHCDLFEIWDLFFGIYIYPLLLYSNKRLCTLEKQLYP
jgi:hypothetical protein